MGEIEVLIRVCFWISIRFRVVSVKNESVFFVDLWESFFGYIILKFLRLLMFSLLEFIIILEVGIIVVF